MLCRYMIEFPTCSKFYYDHVPSLGYESPPRWKLMNIDHSVTSHYLWGSMNIDSDFKASRSSSSDLRIAINPVKLESVYIHISAMSVAMEVVLVISSSVPR